jgi:TP901 family phage tail tape measure protein
MPDFIVTTAFRAKDGITPDLKQMAGAAKGFGRTAEKSFKRAARGALSLKRLVGADLIGRGISRMAGAATRGVGTVVDEFLEFDDTIGRAGAAFPTLVKRGTAEFDDLKNAAREVGETTEFTAAQAALGLRAYAQAGFDSATAMSVLAGTAELATSANVEFAEAASISIDAMEQFSLKSENAEQTAKNLAMVNDTLAKVVNSAKLEFADFGETMKFTGPIAAGLGADFEDMAVLTGLVAKAGIRGSLAGTTLKNTYLGLAAASPQAAKKLKKFGVEVKDQEGNMKDTLSLLIDFKKETDEMGNVQRAAAIKTVFGMRAIAGVNKILDLTNEELEEYRQNIENAEGANSAMADAIRGSLQNKLNVLKSTAIEAGFKILEAFEEDGRTGVEALTEAVRDLDLRGIIEGLREVIDGAKWLFRTIKENQGVIKALVGSFVAFKIATTGIGFIKFIEGLGGIAGAAKGAGSALGAVSQPIGAASVGGVGGAAGAAMGVAGAAVGGAAIGTLLSQAIFQPLFEESTRQAASAGNFLDKASRKIDFGADMTLGEMQALSSGFDRNGQALLDRTFSLEDSFAGVTAFFTGSKGPLDEWQEQIQTQVRLQRQLAIAIAKAKSDIAAGGQGGSQVKIDNNVNIGGNVPPGTTVDTKTSQSAPPVNTGQAGRS